MKNKIAIVIPAYNPRANLIEIVEALVITECSVIVVNDGSIDECDYVFDKIKNFQGITVLKHNTNKGKGAALKTAFEYFLQDKQFINYLGVVCADADGQHLVHDIIAVGNELVKNPNSLVIGSRKFTGEKVPIRSKFGNILTKFIFKALITSNITDTQSGLRGLSKQFLKDCICIKKNGYELETEMLILANSKNIDIKSIEIETVYEKGNKSSHFNPIIDSIKIYYCFVRFIVNALSTSAIDYVVFIAIHLIYDNLLLSLVVARIIACVYNFIFSKQIVFKSDTGVLLAIVKYISLVCLFMIITLFNIDILSKYFHINVYTAKAISEFCLFFISFIVQKIFIFK